MSENELRCSTVGLSWRIDTQQWSRSRTKDYKGMFYYFWFKLLKWSLTEMIWLCKIFIFTTFWVWFLVDDVYWLVLVVGTRLDLQDKDVCGLISWFGITLCHLLACCSSYQYISILLTLCLWVKDGGAVSCSVETYTWNMTCCPFTDLNHLTGEY